MTIKTSPATIKVHRLKVARAAWMISMATVVSLATTASATEPASHMMGRQSHNIGVDAVPAPDTGVIIDGDLSEWDQSGRIWSFADVDVRDRYSARTSMMWDEHNLYVAIEWNDPTPLYNMVNPATDPEDGWKGDSIQLRILADKPLWLTAWCYTPEERPILHLAYWNDPTDARKGQERQLLIGKSGEVELGEGAAVAYRQTSNNTYVQEMRLPWSLVYHDEPAPSDTGKDLRIGMEFLWGDPTGRTWPIHRYADNLQPGQTSREFFWNGLRLWGSVHLRSRGDVEPRRYVAAEDLLRGPIPIRVEVPASASRFTLVIEDSAGRRIRNLAGDLSPTSYGQEVNGDRRRLDVAWDGLDDAGAIVPPGVYQVRGLTHAGLGAEYEMSFYNPGVPPWPTREGASAWGADHGAPRHVATTGEWTIIGWTFAEGGSGIIGVDSQGQKRWGEKRGATAMAAHGDYLYAVASGWHTSGMLVRLGVRDGSYHPFVLDGKERPFELPLADAMDIDQRKRSDAQEAHDKAMAATRGEAVEPANVVAMAAHGDTLAIALESGRLAMLDANSAQLKRLFELPRSIGLAYSSEGRLFALFADATVHEVDPASGERRHIQIDGLGQPTAMTIDRDGNIVITDMGDDNQLKAFNDNGDLIYTAGKRGGRPIRGEFDPQTMMHVSSVAVDATGSLWTTEHWNYPRRVSVWDPETGQLVRDYIGNTGYAATGTFLHDQDPQLAYVGPVEMKLDRDTRQWTVTRVLWVPGPGEHFPVSDTHTQPHRFRSDASGRTREYMFYPPYRPLHPWVLYMEMDSGDWQPVFAMGLVGALTGEIEDNRHEARIHEDAGDFTDLSPYDGFLWNDENDDARVQRDELIVVRNQHSVRDARNGKGPLPTSSGWGNRMQPNDLRFYSSGRDGLFRFRPQRFRSSGAPFYDLASMERLEVELLIGGQDAVPAPNANVLINMAGNHGARGATAMRGIDVHTQQVVWTYPNHYSGVHGSHRAPMPRPGMLIGPLKVTGVAEMGGEIGDVFGVRGNLGQEFFFTADGLYVGAMFRDTRLPNEPLPTDETQLLGMPMDMFTGGGEPFSGWMSRQDDGAVRLTSSMFRQAGAILKVVGLDSIERFDGPSVQIDRAHLAQIEQFLAEQNQATQQERRHTIARIDQPINLDGQLDEWSEREPIQIVSPASSYTGKAWLAYDDEHLYVAYEVEDPTPWINRGRDARRLFKTGDAVDLHLGVAPRAGRDNRQPAAGDVRLLIAPSGGKPTPVLMRPVDPHASRQLTHAYTSPVGTKRFDRVEPRDDIKVSVRTADRIYRLEAAIPIQTLGLRPEPGMTIGGDIGFISSNADGTENTARTYWANPLTNLVNDEPQESWLFPDRWGQLMFE